MKIIQKQGRRKRKERVNYTEMEVRLHYIICLQESQKSPVPLTRSRLSNQSITKNQSLDEPVFPQQSNQSQSIKHGNYDQRVSSYINELNKQIPHFALRQQQPSTELSLSNQSNS